MNFVDNLFNGLGYIEGITIINVEGEILFTAKFNNKLSAPTSNYEVVGKRFLDVYSNLDETTSTAYLAMRNGAPVYIEDQMLKSPGREPITVTSLSIPIRSQNKIVGAIDLSVSKEVDASQVHAGALSAEATELFTQAISDSPQLKSMLENRDEATYHVTDILTCNNQMLKLRESILKAGKTDLPVLIYGETGTGKELVAHAIHNASPRRDGPFIVQNCASIPATLMESILFGTTKGAFTGSVDNTGLLELADGGTLFLDEINSMPLELQPKLLRAIQTGTFRRLGDMVQRKVNVRYLSSTNESPDRITVDGKLRMDLYYRLAVFILEIPPLRERLSDIPLLTNQFVARYSTQFGKKIHQVSNDLYRALAQYAWPGNVRELENVIAYGVSMTDDDAEVLEVGHLAQRLSTCQVADAPAPVPGLRRKIAPPEETSLSEQVAQYEKLLIQEALDATSGNITHAAALLAIPRQTLSRKIKDYNL